jgi:putative peptidoglycan lipid II flippase
MAEKVGSAMKETGKGDSTASTAVVMLCTSISRILGFVRTAVISAFFGAGGQADVINATFAVPNNLRKLLAEGALSSAFIPVLSHAIVKEGENRERSSRLVNSLISFQLIILLPFTILAIIFAGPLVRYVITQFKDPEQIKLAVDLFRFFIVYLVLISVSSVLMALLNSHDRFFIPSLTPIFFSIAVILSIVMLHSTLGVFSMAVGVLCGGIGQILFQVPQTKKLGYRFRFNFFFRDEDFRKILSRWLPVLATSSIFTINQQIAFILASGLETGSVSSLSYALVFWQLPFGVFSASVTTVMFPKMSRQSGRGDIDGLRESLQYSLRFLFVLLIPSAIFLSFFGKEIVAMALQRGRFMAEDTVVTASVLSGYCWGLFGVGAFTFLQRFFYSIRNYKIPFIVAVITATMDVTLSLILKETWLRVRGLAIANSIAFTFGTLVLIILAGRSVGGLALGSMLKTALKVAVSMVPVIVLSLYLRDTYGSWWIEGSSIRGFAFLGLLVTGVTALVLGMYKITRIEMVDLLLSRIIPRRIR